MRVHVMSDLHFEHMRLEFSSEFFKQHEALLAKDPAEVLVLAGDICQIGKAETLWKAKVAQLISPYKKVLYVPGNHEFYDTTFTEADAFLEHIDGDPVFSNFIQLSYGPYVYNGIRFIGDTMWFPDTHQPRYVKRGMADFSYIGTGGRPFEPAVYERHNSFLTDVMGKLKARDVVITHHLPLPASIDTQYRDSDLNVFFMTDMSGYLNEGNMPRMWFHGHTHSPFDYFHTEGAAKMRVYCNPHGYPREGGNSQFWNRIGVDIPD